MMMFPQIIYLLLNQRKGIVDFSYDKLKAILFKRVSFCQACNLFSMQKQFFIIVFFFFCEDFYS